MRTRSVKLVELEKEYGPAELGQDRPENTISVLRISGSRRKGLVATPGIRRDAEFYLHFHRPIDLTAPLKDNLTKGLTQPPELITGLSAYASTLSRKTPARPEESLDRRKPEKDVLTRPKVDQIGYDLPQNGPVHPVTVGHLPVKTGGGTNRRPHKSTSMLLEEALQSVPLLEAHEVLLQREITACRRQRGHKPLAKPSGSSSRRGPEIDR
jgi:hypothetical protein